MKDAPQAEMDAALVSEARDCQFDSDGEHQLIVLSHPRVWERKMMLTTLVKSWNDSWCFYTCLSDIDSEAVRLHVMWKMSGDPDYVIKLRAACNLSAKTPEDLNLHDWRFL